MRLEANRTADSVLALEKEIAALLHTVSEREGEFLRKEQEIATDAITVQEVSFYPHP